MTGPGAFMFLRVPGSLNEIGWDGPQREKLWRYNQHYFDDLVARDAEQRAGWHRALLEAWVVGNPPAAGSGWEPYPTSRRIVNWIKWALAGNELTPACIHSLAIQARWLMKRLETHLLGNHLFANAKALVFAGLYFEGAEADSWRQTGLAIVARELPEQVLADGGHVERSTMYHALALEDMLDLCNLVAFHEGALSAAQREAARNWRTVTDRMRDWLRAMCHPDGEIAFFNDAAFGVAPSVSELEAYATRLALAAAPVDAEPPRWLRASGYARLANANAVALLDLAPIGPDYLPGHAHADTLCFELSVHGQRVLVNSGTSCYGLGAERLRQRGTAAHNTVVVNGADSSEVWGGFRVARRARLRSVSVSATDSLLEARGVHDGYARLPGRPMHERCWNMRRNALTVQDAITGGSGVLAEARFHFHPDVPVRLGPEHGSGSAMLPDGRLMMWEVELGQARIEPSTWHPAFGVVRSNACLCVRLVDGRSVIRLSWS